MLHVIQLVQYYELQSVKGERNFEKKKKVKTAIRNVKGGHGYRNLVDQFYIRRDFLVKYLMILLY